MNRISASALSPALVGAVLAVTVPSPGAPPPSVCETVGRLSPAVGPLSPAVGSLSPAVGWLSPAIGGLSPAVGGLSPAVGSLSPVTTCT